MTLVAEIPLAGTGGEPVDFVRTIVSHGVAELSSNRLDFAERALETTLPVAGGARTVRLTGAGGKLRIENARTGGDVRHVPPAQPVEVRQELEGGKYAYFWYVDPGAAATADDDPAAPMDQLW